MDHALTWWRWLLLFLLMGGLVGVWLYLNRNRLHPKQWLAPQNTWIQIIERKWLGPKNTLLLIQVESQFFLLSQTAQGSSWQTINPIDIKSKIKNTPNADNPAPTSRS